MGVYINGMEMPTSCRKCGLMMNCDDCEGLKCYCLPLKKSIGNLEKFRDEPYVLTDKRRDDCPLISVPEHGDLIDRDVLKAKQQEDADLFIDAYTLMEKSRRDEALNAVANIVNAPTIIPAEPPKEEQT